MIEKVTGSPTTQQQAEPTTTPCTTKQGGLLLNLNISNQDYKRFLKRKEIFIENELRLS